MRALIALALAVACAGCMTAKTSRTNPDGTGDSLQVNAFLFKIGQGTYSTGSGTSITVTDATPDQQSIATLSGGIVELSKAAMVFAAGYTNATTTITNGTIP